MNDLIAYETEVDSKGRPKAVKAKIVGRVWSFFTKIWIIAAFVLAAYAVCVFLHLLPFHFLSIYAFMSILTIQQYSIDKGEAHAGRWRTSEANLHFFELAGGWPGALFAQYFYRHKYRKLKYQLVFWFIVLIHGISWAWLASNPDAIKQFKSTLRQRLQTYAQPNRLHDSMKSPSRQYGVESRARIIVKNDKRIIEGIIVEVNPLVGIIVALPAPFEGVGVIDKSRLEPSFTNSFSKGEPIHVGIRSISMTGSTKQIDLERVEE